MNRKGILKRTIFLAYGLLAYAAFFVTIVYAIGFMGNLWVPKSIDSGIEGNIGAALVINGFLLTLFAVQHSVMARPAFKEWWTRYVPKAIERSTFVLLSSAILLTLFWQWRPLQATVWEAHHPAAVASLYGLFAMGWGLVFLSSFLINHFDLFGLRQVYLNFTRQPYTHLPFRLNGLYRIVRHPLMLGFLLAFWATPHMTLGHFFFAAVTTMYILAAVQLEERDLEQFHGAQYRKYKEEVPMIVPMPGKVASATARSASTGRAR